MPAKPKAEPDHASRVESLLHDGGATHVRARKHGAAVIVEFGPDADPVKHLRLRRDTVDLWCLDIADHRDRWERTPLRDNLDALVNAAMESFPWTLTPVRNPARSSDPGH